MRVHNRNVLQILRNKRKLLATEEYQCLSLLLLLFIFWGMCKFSITRVVHNAGKDKVIVLRNLALYLPRLDQVCSGFRISHGPYSCRLFQIHILMI